MPDSSNNSNTRVGAMAPDASTSRVEWGPEIRVDGKRPEWLQANDFIDWQWESLRWHADRPDEPWNARGMPADHVAIENGVVAIRLRANHPHYRQPTTPERDPALWDRMAAREVTVSVMSEDDVIDGRFAKYNDYGPLTAITEALRDLGIVRENPVDPDLIEARRIASYTWQPGAWTDEQWERRVMEGGEDNDRAVRAALAAIKRGRQLATPEVSHVG